MWTSGTASDYADLLDRLNTFLTATGSAFGLEYEGTGTGTFTAYAGGASSVAETFTITATSATVFDVIGSVSGDVGDATVGTPFSVSTIAFTITAGGTAFEVGDEFTISTAPPWTEKRKALGARLEALEGNTGGNAVQNIVDGSNAIGAVGWRVSIATFPNWIEIEFFEAETIASYQLAIFHFSYAYGMPKDWKLQYYSGSWIDLDSQIDEESWGESEVRTYTVSSPVSATKYRLYITAGNSSTLALGALRMLRSDGVDAAFGQVIWEAPGNDGDSAILVGVHPFERQDADYYDWEIAGFDAHLASSLWKEQAGYQGKLFLPLWDASIPYWFICDGRRAIVIAKLSTQYELAYLGLLEPFFSTEQWPYPLALGGALAFGENIPAWSSTDYRFTNTSNAHRAFTHSDAQGYSFANPYLRQMRVRDWSGTWLGFDATSEDGLPSLNPDGHFIWPYSGGLELLDPNLDGSYATWPVILNTGTPNTVGQLSGVACVTGQGLTAETLIRKGQIDWIAFHNVYRTDREDFLAIALD